MNNNMSLCHSSMTNFVKSFKQHIVKNNDILLFNKTMNKFPVSLVGARGLMENKFPRKHCRHSHGVPTVRVSNTRRQREAGKATTRKSISLQKNRNFRESTNHTVPVSLTLLSAAARKCYGLGQVSVCCSCLNAVLCCKTLCSSVLC